MTRLPNGATGAALGAEPRRVSTRFVAARFTRLSAAALSGAAEAPGGAKRCEPKAEDREG